MKSRRWVLRPAARTRRGSTRRSLDALANPALLTGSVNSTGIFVRGRIYANQRDSEHSINRLVISPNFFEVMEIPVLIGRAFTARDNESAPKVVIINEAAAKKYFPNENPIGQRFGSSVETSSDSRSSASFATRIQRVRDPAPPPCTCRINRLAPSCDHRGANGAVPRRNRWHREAVRRSTESADDGRLDAARTGRASVRPGEDFAQAYSLFGGLALLLAAIVVGLMSYSVSRRTNEIGIRMALGAQRQDVLRLVMRESMILVASGVVIGVAVALGVSRFVATLLYGLAATDAVTIVASISVMVVVAALAGFVPARRASRVDPMVALRYE